MTRRAPQTGAIRVLAALLLILAAPVRADDGELTPERGRQILRDALTAFDEGVALARDDAARAEQLFRRSAAAFETLVADGAQNAALEYNLGNTYFRLGELGRAILHYRRAQRLDPGHAKLPANLRYARNRVEPSITPGGEQRLLHRLLFWHYSTSLNLRFWFTLSSSVAGWLALMIWLRRRSTSLGALALLAIALGLANAASAAWQLHGERARPHALVIQGEHTLRLGRGAGYDPAMEQPLGPGVELRILQQRGDWIEVRLPNDQTGWLPAQALERV